MAAPTRRKKRRRGGGKAAGRGKSDRSSRSLRRLDAPLRERRFEPKASRRSMLAVVLLSLGGVALGVGVYGQWLRDEAVEALAAAPYLLAAGLLLVAAYWVVGRGATRILRVGDLGVGFEAGGESVKRTPWHRVSAVTLEQGGLLLDADGGAIRVSLAEHEPALRRVLAEARERIPDKVDVHAEDQERLGEPGSAEGELVRLEPPQVTGQRCMATDEPLTFEKDVRMCARCAALYHKSGVPRVCEGCGAKLRG